eukprot:5140382-Prorocentrum_lima.AAC.1
MATYLSEQVHQNCGCRFTRDVAPSALQSGGNRPCQRSSTCTTRQHLRLESKRSRMSVSDLDTERR